MNYRLLLLLLLLVRTGLAQEKYTISGYITDSSTGETVIGAKVFVDSLKQGAISNTYGFYSLNIPAGDWEVKYSGLGYDDQYVRVQLSRDTVIDVELGTADLQLNQVDVNANRGEHVKSTQLGQIELQVEKIKTLPAFMGEVDIIKTIQLLPGVSSASEGGQGFYVRGGGPDQNLVLLDEATVYNASHLFGFFSVFNVDAVKSVNLIKGGMPANFGGRLSSVLEVNMNEGNYKQVRVKGGVGLISSRLTVEGPLKKDKGSFIVSARRTYIDLIMKAAIPKSSPFSGTSYFFYDMNLKMNYKLGEKDRIYLSGYYGQDKFIYANREDDFSVDMPWGNGVGSFRWNHLFSSKLFVNTSLTFTDYRFSFGSDQDEFQFKLLSGIRDYGAKVDFSWFPSTRHKVKFGLNYTYHTFTPTSVSAKQDDVVFDTGDAQKLFSHESAVYILDEFDVNENLRINAGLRYSSYQHVGPFKRFVKDDISNPDSVITYGRGDLIKSYGGFEPRVSLRWLLSPVSSFKAGYSFNYQYVHLASISAVSLPTDIWYPATDRAKPEQGWQGAVGYFHDFAKGKYESSVEVYYKGLKNLVEFKNGAQPADNVSDNTDNLLTFGRGWSYGVELFVKKTSGKLTGWIGYTWSKTERKFEQINDGNPFPAKYDRRHDLSVVASYKLSDRWTFGSAFIFASGNTLTLPSSWYVQDQNILFKYGPRNSTRMAPYHRLDISATLYDKPTRQETDPVTGETIEVKKRFRSNWSFSIYNVYNRANPYFLYVDPDGDLLKGDFKISIKQVTLFPIIPGVTWNFEF